MDNEGEKIETVEAQKELGATDAELWLKRIDRQIDCEKDWRTEAKIAEEIYEGTDKENSYFNILHSNTETLTPALYNSQPVPDVRRRWDSKDLVAKHVVDLTERLLTFSMDQYDFDDVADHMVKDSYVAGRGMTRLRYSPEISGDKIMDQSTQMEHVQWDMIILGPSKSWARMPWIAYKHYLTRDDLIALDPVKGKDINLDAEDKEKDTSTKEKDGVFSTALVYEVWDKASKSVLFIAANEKDFPIKVLEDPLKLQDFFPSPKPLQTLTRLRSMVPICPYTIYKDLVTELNDITSRIQSLIDQVRVKGLVDSALEADLRALEDAADGEFIPTKKGSSFAQGAGGIADAIAHWPIDPVIQALGQLYVQRDQVKQTIYEVTGVSDILRGASDARETLGAQQIKTQWGSLRIQTMQGSVAKWARDVFRKKVDLFSQHYEPYVISKITALPSTPEQEETWPQVMEMFKSDMTTFKIDVETDSTIRADMVRSQETMNQFLTSTGQFAQSMGGIVQLKPEILPVTIEIFTAFARKYKLGKQAEDALDQLQTQMEEQQAHPQEEKPDPAEQKLQMDMQAAQQKVQLEQQSMQFKLQADQANIQIEQQKAELELQAKQMDAQMKQLELQSKERLANLDIQIKEVELAMKRQTAEIDAQTKLANLEFTHAAEQQRLAQAGAVNG